MTVQDQDRLTGILCVGMKLVGLGIRNLQPWGNMSGLLRKTGQFMGQMNTLGLLKGKDWSGYTPPEAASWVWKHMCKARGNQ